ncbi:ABC transporter substrate-binding protein [Cohnella sp. CFH 77786]|uniref:ABC transporter substrate-binding protein n=1 Tax=Cohnella sp. CFH 77786 TaxID=2662265 RepID=UPI001C608142|nr:extracellular solute-binding protein [Cohnella sp. CFH 77786]
MQQKKKWGALALALALTGSLLAGCGKSGGEESGSSAPASASPSSSASPSDSASPSSAAPAEAVTLKYMTWDYSDRTKSTDAFIQAVKDKFNITIDMQNIPTDQYATSIKTKFASNDVPDLVQVHGLDQNLFSGAEKLTIDPDKFADLSDLPSVSEFLPAVIEARKKNVANKLFYVPVSTNVLGVIYNKKVFSDNGIALPTNYDEFVAACEKLKAAGVTPIAGGFKDAWVTQIIPFIAFGQYINAKDMSIREKLADGSLKYADIKADVTKVLNVQQEWADKGYFQKGFLGTDINVASQLVGTGKAAMLINGTWQYKAVQDADPNAQIGFFALPLNAPGEKTAVPTISDSGFIVSMESKHVDKAKEALNYYLSAENQTRVISDLNGIPTNTKVKVDSPFVTEVQAAMAAGEVQPDFWNAGGYYRPSGSAFLIDKEMQNLLAKGITIDDFIAKYDAENAKVLKK